MGGWEDEVMDVWDDGRTGMAREERPGSGFGVVNG
jgi:hypothetical protein